MKRPTKAPKQITEFRKAARDLGADESPERFDAALKAVGQHKPTEKPPVLRHARRGRSKATE